MAAGTGAACRHRSVASWTARTARLDLPVPRWASAIEAWTRGDWPWVLQLVLGTLGSVIGGVFAIRWPRRREVVDPRLVQVKLSRDACSIELRLAVVAPAFADAREVEERLERLVAAYRPCAPATGYGLVPRPFKTRAVLDCSTWRSCVGSTSAGIRQQTRSLGAGQPRAPGRRQPTPLGNYPPRTARPALAAPSRGNGAREPADDWHITVYNA